MTRDRWNHVVLRRTCSSSSSILKNIRTILYLRGRLEKSNISLISPFHPMEKEEPTYNGCDYQTSTYYIKPPHRGPTIKMKLQGGDFIIFKTSSWKEVKRISTHIWQHTRIHREIFTLYPLVAASYILFILPHKVLNDILFVSNRRYPQIFKKLFTPLCLWIRSWCSLLCNKRDPHSSMWYPLVVLLYFSPVMRKKRPK